MKDNYQLIYITEEVKQQGILLSKLSTSNIWVAVADVLIKSRNLKKEGMLCQILPIIKTKKMSDKALFLSVFFLDNKGDLTREVSITTKLVAECINEFEKVSTNSYYQSEQYLTAIKGLVSHMQKYTSNETSHLLSLMVFAIADDNHLFWKTYSPTYFSGGMSFNM